MGLVFKIRFLRRLVCSMKWLKEGINLILLFIVQYLRGLCKTGNTDRAVRFLRPMESRGSEPNIVAYNTILDCLCKKGLLKEALDLFSEVKVKGIRPNIITYSCLIRGMCNSGQQEEATRLLNEMVDNNIS
ncbi:hypothetical protein Goari_010409, partial [Gossypium aridum]|nr:hypothetical protein [Gossypium aridum]